MLQPVCWMLCPEREGVLGGILNFPNSHPAFASIPPPGRNWKDNGRVQRAPFTRRGACPPEGCLPGALMGMPVLTVAIFQGTCVSCSLIRWSKCPADSERTVSVIRLLPEQPEQAHSVLSSFLPASFFNPGFHSRSGRERPHRSVLGS